MLDSLRPVPRPRLPSFLEARLEPYAQRVSEVWRDRHLFHRPVARPGAIELNTNDYLRMSSHPEVVRARQQAVAARRGASVMSAVFLDDGAPQRRFELDLARYVGSEDAVLCQSGWAANVGLLQSIAGPDVPVYLDFFVHMSLREGAWRSGAPVYSFRHNDLAHLERCVARHGPGLIAVDSLYSTLGTVCPLRELASLARARDCALVVDESHSLGTHGPQGAGMVADLGLHDAVLFRTSSLSKTFAARGGVIACPASFVDYFRLESRIAVFSSAVHSYEALVLLRTLDVLRGADAPRRALQHNAEQLRHGLCELGYPAGAGSEQIIAVETGTEYRTLVVRDALAQRGVVAAPFLPPATSAHGCLLRLTVTSELGPREIARVLDAFAAVREEVALSEWASGLRRGGGTRGRRPALRCLSSGQ